MNAIDVINAVRSIQRDHYNEWLKRAPNPFPFKPLDYCQVIVGSVRDSKGREGQLWITVQCDKDGNPLWPTVTVK